jgi:hypothetical protein
MALLGYTAKEVDVMAGQVLEAAVFIRDGQYSQELVDGLVNVWSFLDGLLCEGRV